MLEKSNTSLTMPEPNQIDSNLPLEQPTQPVAYTIDGRPLYPHLQMPQAITVNVEEEIREGFVDARDLRDEESIEDEEE